MKKIPVILDTDIGSDIDDSWALAMLLRSPELDLKLAVSCLDDTVYKAKCICKLIEQGGYSDIPVGIGIPTSDAVQELCEWVKGYSLKTYPGKVYEDGVQAIIDTVMQSEEEVVIIAIGPFTNIAAALDREPAIAKKSRIIGVHASIYNGHGLDEIQRCSEYNIRADLAAARKVFAAEWDITLAPLDISAHIIIGDDNYQHILARRDSDPLIGAVLECFDAWMVFNNATYYKTHTTSLYDTTAIYIAAKGDWNLIFEDHTLTIDDGGYTNDDPQGKLCHCAVYWRYKDMFYKFLTERLLGQR